jgi:hypothetical protein
MITHPGFSPPVLALVVVVFEILKSPFLPPLTLSITKQTATAASDTGISKTESRGSTKPASKFCNLFGLDLGMVVMVVVERRADEKRRVDDDSVILIL